MTTAGIFGTVTGAEGDVINIEIAPGVVMRVARAAIGRRLNQELEEFEAGETFDDIDDELGESVADETPSTNGPAVGNDGPTTSPPAPEPPAPTTPQTAEPPTVIPPAAP